MNTQMTEKQEKAMSKTARALTEKQATLPITNYENPWLEAAAEGGNELGKLLKFVKSEWLIGNDVIPDGSEYVAYINQLIRGWVRFEDGQVIDRRLGKVADGFKPQPREELPDSDPANWPDKDADDNPRDPWSLQWYLPLVAVESGEFVTFVTGSVGGNDAVCDLCRIYGHKMRDGLLPIVALRRDRTNIKNTVLPKRRNSRSSVGTVEKRKRRQFRQDKSPQKPPPTIPIWTTKFRSS
jgi:hypothetical protein